MATSWSATIVRVAMANKARGAIVGTGDLVREKVVEKKGTLIMKATLAIRGITMGDVCSFQTWLLKLSGSIWKTICARLAMWYARIFLRTIEAGPVVLGTYNFDYILTFGISVASLSLVVFGVYPWRFVIGAVTLAATDSGDYTGWVEFDWLLAVLAC